MELEKGSSRFRRPKTVTEEKVFVDAATPSSTKYKNKWAKTLFVEWQRARAVQFPVLDCGGVFKDYNWNKVKPLSEEIEEMDAVSLNYWLSKFVTEVTKRSGERYPPRSIYGIVASLKRYLEEVNGSEALNPLDVADRRFCIFRRCLDAEMKDGTKEGLHIKYKKEEKQFVSEEEEQLFWQKGLLGIGTAKSLLDTVYFYNGKLFGLRGGDHRSIVVNNFEIHSNYIKFEENSSKTFHGGLSDLKYVPRIVKHVCHAEGEEHEPCLVQIYRLYIGLVDSLGKQCAAFYFRPSVKKFGYEKSPVGINTLNKILPNLCQAVGVKRKTSHSLRVTCASSLFNAGVEEKLIRQRTGHRSNALFQYEKPTEANVAKVSSVLGPKVVTSTTTNVEKDAECSDCFNYSGANVAIEGGQFSNCTINVIMKE